MRLARRPSWLSRQRTTYSVTTSCGSCTTSSASPVLTTRTTRLTCWLVSASFMWCGSPSPTCSRGARPSGARRYGASVACSPSASSSTRLASLVLTSCRTSSLSWLCSRRSSCSTGCSPSTCSALAWWRGSFSRTSTRTTSSCCSTSIGRQTSFACASCCSPATHPSRGASLSPRQRSGWSLPSRARSSSSSSSRRVAATAARPLRTWGQRPACQLLAVPCRLPEHRPSLGSLPQLPVPPLRRTRVAAAGAT
mmetsp:Transcript_25444/g.51128  ORF Transcript_25444/g.51128 Transcript_25444/m.51128 type:complete len:252 (-) Transcript_25444:397-1152(-)